MVGFVCYPGTFAASCLGPSATSCGIFDLLASDPGPSFQRLSAAQSSARTAWFCNLPAGDGTSSDVSSLMVGDEGFGFR